MQVIAGLSAFNSFELQKKQAKLEALTGACVLSIRSQFVYLFSKPVDPEHMDAANKLLNEGESASLEAAKEGELQLLTTPRVGTRSPWGSKAAEVFASAGVEVERIERAVLYTVAFDQSVNYQAVCSALYDPMTMSVFDAVSKAQSLFLEEAPKPLTHIDVLQGGKAALEQANLDYGFALSDQEVDYLVEVFAEQIGRNPTDAELMMFAQANSEHCRHKIFNAQWLENGQAKPRSLFKMIKNTYEVSPQGVLGAYKDNASVIQGFNAKRFYPKAEAGTPGAYGFFDEQIDILMKVETHNHPTGIAPFAGAATGSGGEIRDEGATGRGSKPKAGLAAFNVSSLQLPNLPERWEAPLKAHGRSNRMADALEIMTEGPLGAAAFNNEFGRPNLCGYFRVFEQDLGGSSADVRGYHKPIMLAGGYGNINRDQVAKGQIQDGDYLIVLGGPAMLIGLGGGAASSVDGGELSSELDFASVQRDNPEMERRAQEVIDTCWALGESNPIVSIHDVGAGGLSNAMPELANDNELGASLELREVPLDEPGMSPMEIWSNESQERYVLGVKPEDLARFQGICERERAPYAVLGVATKVRHLKVNDSHFSNLVVDMPMNALLGNTPQMQRVYEGQDRAVTAFDTSGLDLKQSVLEVLRHPTVASKSFLITIGDRSITGMVARDQMVGKYQVPVADVAVTATSLDATTGEAMAMGERPPLALIDPKASARMAVGEALTNIAAAPINTLSDVKLSANWMAASGFTDAQGVSEDKALYDAVEAVGMELCPELGVCIPVGKDSLSMRASWKDSSTQADKQVVSPMTVVISAFAPVTDVRCVLTPELKLNQQTEQNALIWVDLSQGKHRLGGSILAQVNGELGAEVPNADAGSLKAFFELIQRANQDKLLHAYHDVGDGGLLATLAEMQFCSRLGVAVELNQAKLFDQLFAEELGAVVQVASADLPAFKALASSLGLEAALVELGSVSAEFDGLQINGDLFLRAELQQHWAKVSYEVQRLRDNPETADQEYSLITDPSFTGLPVKETFDLNQPLESLIEAPALLKTKPKVAVLREQGVNGQLEMAAGFVKAGFEAVDVHMSDLVSGRLKLADFQGMVACGGFSFGDVLGAGGGWAKSILMNPKLRDQFAQFFETDSSFTLGVCNGCQMVSQLTELIPGANFPRFVQNTSARFEARVASVKVEPSASVLLQGMHGSVLPIAVAHGEGRVLASAEQVAKLASSKQLVLSYVDSSMQPTETYPLNPNGSPLGATGLCSADGRVTIMMPHPERTLKAFNHSFKPEHWTQDGAWMRLFNNARVFAG